MKKNYNSFTLITLIKDAADDSIRYLDEIHHDLDALDLDQAYHIIAIDNGHDDQRSQALIEWSHHHPKFTYKIHTQNKGYSLDAQSLRVAAALASTNTLIIDRLLPDNVNFYVQALKLLRQKSLDLVIGNIPQQPTEITNKISSFTLEKSLQLFYPKHTVHFGAPLAFRRNSFLPLLNDIDVNIHLWAITFENYARKNGLSIANQLLETTNRNLNWREILRVLPTTTGDLSRNLLSKLRNKAN